MTPGSRRARHRGRPEPAGPPSTRGRALAAAGLGAACLSASAILIKLADTGPATAAFYRCFLALPVLIALAIVERRRHGPRRPAAHLGAVAAGAFLAVDLVLWNHTIADVGAGIATVLGNLQVLFVKRWPPGCCCVSARDGGSSWRCRW